MKNKKRLHIALSVTVILLILFVVWVAWSNTALSLTEIKVTSEKLPKSFYGYRIAQISDLHNAEFGKDNERLLTMLASAEPDIIVITGDIVDSSHTDIDVALLFTEIATEIAPTYYVTGNHEAWITNYTELKEGLMSVGVTVLENESVQLVNGDESITLIGLNDPAFSNSQSGITSSLNGIEAADDSYKILLSHRPELFDGYVANGVDLVFSGHAHGGQFRLPFIGGLVAPDQGLFPEYDAGLYTKGNTSMIISRGLGNSIIPFRLNNRPEIVVVTLGAI